MIAGRRWALATALAGLGVVAAGAPPPGVPTRPAWIPAAGVARLAARLLDAARPPRCRIQLEMYELGSVGLVGDLLAARRRGCAVQVTVDGTEGQSVMSASRLRRGGVDVRLARLVGAIDHVKALVVDGRAALLGGVNWGTESGDTTDADLYLPDDPILAGRLAADFADPGARVTAAAQGAEALTGPAIEAAFTRLVRRARGTVLLLANYCTAYAVQDALAAAAVRGVRVEVLLNRSAYGAGGAARWLSAHRARVRWATGPYLHAKVLLTAGGGLVGSANWSYSGMAFNRELDAEIPGPVLAGAWAWGSAAWARGIPA